MTYRAIVVDDEPLARRGIISRLRPYPQFEVIGECGNGEDALLAISEHHPDLIFLDVQMPEMDGFEASRQITTRWPAGQRPRIIAMTANAMQGDRELCLAAGMDDYVSKPIRVDELVAALMSVPTRQQ